MENLLEAIGSFADLDTRRHLGLAPRPLGPSQFVPRPIPPVTWRYWPKSMRLVYLSFGPEDGFHYEVYTGLIRIGGEFWKAGTDARHYSVWEDNHGNFNMIDQPAADYDGPWTFAGIPEVIN